jgi:hypothetical protein
MKKIIITLVMLCFVYPILGQSTSLPFVSFTPVQVETPIIEPTYIPYSKPIGTSYQSYNNVKSNKEECMWFKVVSLYDNDSDRWISTNGDASFCTNPNDNTETLSLYPPHARSVADIMNFKVFSVVEETEIRTTFRATTIPANGKELLVHLIADSDTNTIILWIEGEIDIFFGVVPTDK